MQLFRSIRSSIYGPEYYDELLTKPFWFSLKYFCLLVVFLAFCITLFESVFIVPKMTAFFRDIGAKIVGYYPDNLEVTIQDGKASVNQPEPYLLPFPDEFKKQYQNDLRQGAPPDNLIVIDTKNQFTIDGFKNYKTEVLLTKDSVIADDKGEIRIYPLGRAPNTKVTKALIAYYVGKFAPFLGFLTPIFIVLLFLLFIFLLGIDLVYLVFGALLVWLVAKLKKLKIDYTKAYQLALHAVTLSMIFESIFLVFPRASVPLLYTASLVVLAWVNLRDNVDAAAGDPL